MTKYYLLLFLAMGMITGCFNENNQDREKVVEMTIYPEVGYGSALMSQTFTEELIFSESDDKTKRHLSNIITEGFDFEYERGYEYTFKAKKIWMSNPPQDVSSIKYVFMGSLNKSKVVTEDSEETMNITVQPHVVRFHPRFSREDGTGQDKVYDALLCRNESAEKTLVLKNIEGFNFEEGYKYVLAVKRVITANPYSEKYELLDIIKKQKE